jgi:phenylalanyl-tRNA synthetase beta chain
MPPSGQPQPIDVVIEDAELCPRYCAQVFEVRPTGHTPDWMRERLDACGMRSISPIVDVTNYVMLEMGQPTHAFDYTKLAGRTLRIRRAKPGEKVTTLDGAERALDPDMLVIADGDRPQAVAGVMGGAVSEIGAATKLMVLESAYFKPASVRRTSKRLALKTEASTRFERGADVNAAPAAIERIAALLQQIGAAQPLGPIIDRYPSPQPPITLWLRSTRIERVLGMPVPKSSVPAILSPLGFTVFDEGQDEDGTPAWPVRVPSFRVDVQREIDLIEEVARHDGYASLPATIPDMEEMQPPHDARILLDRRLRTILTSCGLSEAMTFAFIEASSAAPFADAGAIVRVHNPLSEKFAVLRPSLLPGLVDAASHNRRHGRADVRLFETGTRFDATRESRAAAAVWCGAGTAPNWAAPTRPVDFYDVKGVVDTVGRAFGLELAFTQADDVPYLTAGRTARVAAGDRRIGLVGPIEPAILEARGFPSGDTVWAFELDTALFLTAPTVDDLRAQSLPQFPSVVRDLSILVDSTLPAAAVRGTIRASGPSTLVDAAEFDRYKGKGVPDDRVSLSLRLTFRSPERTLTDAEVDAAMDRIVGALADAHGAVRR